MNHTNDMPEVLEDAIASLKNYIKEFEAPLQGTRDWPRATLKLQRLLQSILADLETRKR